jgi:hypothetical protein
MLQSPLRVVIRDETPMPRVIRDCISGSMIYYPIEEFLHVIYRTICLRKVRYTSSRYGDAKQWLRLCRSYGLHDQGVALGPRDTQHPLLDLPCPGFLLDKVNRILAAHQELGAVGLPAPPGRTVLCRGSRSEMRSVGSVLDVDTDIGDAVRGVHGPNAPEDGLEDDGKATDDFFVAVVNFKDDVFSSPCRGEKRGVVAIAANERAVHGVSDGLTCAKGGQGVRVGNQL